MEAAFRYGGNEFPVVTGTRGSLRVSLDELVPTGQPCLDVYLTDPSSGDALTAGMAEVLGRALLAWAADVRLAGL